MLSTLRISVTTSIKGDLLRRVERRECPSDPQCLSKSYTSIPGIVVESHRLAKQFDWVPWCVPGHKIQATVGVYYSEVFVCWEGVYL